MPVTLAGRAWVAATVVLAACSQTPSEPGPSFASGEAGTMMAVELSAGAGGTTAAGSGGALPVPIGSGVPTPITWNVIAESSDSSVYAYATAAASRGQDAAVVYVESTATTPPSARVVMQRFDAAGQRLGALIVLASNPEQRGGVTLASDGQQYAACWNYAPGVHCALVDEQGQVQSNALALVGQYPTIVASPGGWAIGYEASDTVLRLQALTPALELSGGPVDLKLSAPFRYALGPLLTPTPSGFALVGATLEDGHDALLRLGSDLQPLTSAIPLGRDFWFYGQLVASDTRAAVSLSYPYGSYLLLLDGEQVTAEFPVAGGGKAGMDHALLLTSGGIGAAWLTGDAHVRRRFFADGRDAEIGLGAHDVPGAPINTPVEGTESYQQLLLVGDRTLLVGRTVRGGLLSGTAAIRVGTLTFP